MADPERALSTNAPGDFFVDATCIDCDTCRWLAPATFEREGELSCVRRQPTDDAERFAAELALIACPTGSIGVRERRDLGRAARAFPRLVDLDVHHLGFHDETTFGAASYLIVRPHEPGGNVMVDVPRWNDGLARRIAELGGVGTLFLTHVDDVGSHARWARHFGARRVMHADDAVSGVETTIEGLEPHELAPGLVVLPTPGHTAGSACLSWRDEFLFSGDTLAFSRSRGHVYAFRDACWFDWRVLIESVERLAQRDFEWILPGHGSRCHFERAAMREQLARCLAWMRART
ncbi:MAG: MBL fold metallo-hydrolase [Planctomycetes bacterium]|nr:MBL fold metallo-hydrolase [Planctomycetota bacterium]